MTKFITKVTTYVKMIPPGKVVSYGQIATKLGSPRAARQVGWALHLSDGKDDIPWWRVINNSGRITIKGSLFNTPQLQKKLLQMEGVEVSDLFEVKIEKYRFYFKND